jgi:MYXO-CTERM domain-containing protein
VSDEGYDIAGGTCSTHAPGGPIGGGAGLFGAFGIALAWLARRRRSR